jgi:AcrR family transcriptional regulator
MKPHQGHRRKPGERARITLADIVDAARRVYERTGVAGLSMRTVADELGVAPNALYSHIYSKDDLVDELIDSILGAVAAPTDDRDWQEALFALMKSSRAVLLEHGDLMPFFMSRATRGPNALRLGEQTLGHLARGGVTGEEAVTALRVLLVYTIGFAAYEYPRRTDDAPEDRTRRSLQSFSDASAGPHMRSLAGSVAAHPDRKDFERGLHWIIQGIASRAPDRRG